MQKVEVYYDMLEAKRSIDEHIRKDWRVHTCTMGCYMAGYHPRERVLVIYEK